jgi:hypothetical protein
MSVESRSKTCGVTKHEFRRSILGSHGYKKDSEYQVPSLGEQGGRRHNRGRSNTSKVLVPFLRHSEAPFDFHGPHKLKAKNIASGRECAVTFQSLYREGVLV